MCLIRSTLQCQRIFALTCPLRHLSNDCNVKTIIYIASAVRTPIANYAEGIANQLPTLITETALKQAAIPRDTVARVFAANLKGELQLHKQTKCTVVENSLEALFNSIAAMQSKVDNAQVTIAVGTTDYATLQQTSEECDDSTEMLTRFNRAWCDGIYDAEVMPVHTRKAGTRQLVLVTRDEATQSTAQLTECVSGNVALTLCTQKMAAYLRLKPFARILAYEQELINDLEVVNDTVTVIEQLLKKVELTVNDIKAWEMPLHALPCIETLQLCRETVNKYGCVAALSAGNAAPTALFSLTHMAHVLPTDAFGCVISYEGSHVTALLIQNISQQQSTQRTTTTTANKHQLPLITLYTKYPCPLCDVVLDELKANFAGQYKLEKVDLTEKNNIRFLRLYRHDIPVVFLNGQFLCMHKLNIKLLQRKLEQIKS